MIGLFIWAHSYCRSTLGFFRGLGHAYGVPVKLCIWKVNAKLRTNVGFTEDEFSDMDITFIGNDIDLSSKILNDYAHYHHIFGAYQAVDIYQKLILQAKQLGCHIAIISEAPCNMNEGFKRYIKGLYTKFVLPSRVKRQIEAADFIVNLSGENDDPLIKVGWDKKKIISCGYYSPRIEGTKLVKRTAEYWKEFTILLTGLHQWHRSPILLIKALKEIKEQGYSPTCYITQDGPLLSEMKRMVEKFGLTNVKFLGFVKMSELVTLYETCSVYVGSGNYEPWGIRLNDVLQCGSPLIVNEGMGGHKLVKDYGCGLTFERNDYKGLASALIAMMSDEQKYLAFAENAARAALHIDPEIKAAEISTIINKDYIGW